MKKQLIRQRLMRRRADLLTRYRDELARADEEVETVEPELIDHANEQWHARVLSLLGETDARALATVVAALRRLDDGTYGKCVECGGPIGAPRLDAIPEAATCIDCATGAERVSA